MKYNYVLVSKLMDKKSLIISDLDGTLLNNNAELSDYTISVVNRLIEEGYHFSIATARSLESVVNIVKPLKLKIPVILHNGNDIYDFSSKIYMIRHFMPKGIVQEILDYYIGLNFNPIIYGLNKRNESKIHYLKAENPSEIYYINKRIENKDPRLVQVEFLDINALQIHEINVIGKKKILDPIYDHISNQYEVGLHYTEHIYCRGYWWLEITHPEATKKQAIEYLLKFLNVENVICFGDSSNDISMFEIANEKYAVANAIPSLKDIASEVIYSNENDGVAKYLEQFLKKGSFN